MRPDPPGQVQNLKTYSQSPPSHSWRAVPSHRRLLGWMRRRFRVAPGSIWHRLDIGEFCNHCGLSERTGRYALQRIREEAEERGIRFRTVFKHDAGRKGAWVVLFANEAELLFDQEPLFRTEDGRHRHIRPKLTEDNLTPTKQGHRIDVERRSAPERGDDTGEHRGRSPANTEPARSPCNRYIGRDSSGVSAEKYKHAPVGDFRASRGRWRHRWRTKPISEAGEQRLRRKAGAIVRRLSRLWWDNCKVESPAESTEARAGVMGFVMTSMKEGFTESEISAAVDLALHRLHMTATDRGERFTAASTITRAKEILAKDTRTRRERVTSFYDQRRRDLEAVRAAMAEAMG